MSTTWQAVYFYLFSFGVGARVFCPDLKNIMCGTELNQLTTNAYAYVIYSYRSFPTGLLVDKAEVAFLNFDRKFEN